MIAITIIIGTTGFCQSIYVCPPLWTDVVGGGGTSVVERLGGEGGDVEDG